MLEFLRKILSLFLSSFNRKKINLADYPIEMDYGMLSSEQAVAMDNILMACEVGGAGAEIPVLTQKEFDEVVTHIGMHFGDEDICKNIALKRQNAAVVNLTLYAQAKAHKAELDAKPQPYSIYKMKKASNGIVSVYARHVCYNLDGWVVAPFSARGLSEALTKLKENRIPSEAFSENAVQQKNTASNSFLKQRQQNMEVFLLINH